MMGQGLDVHIGVFQVAGGGEGLAGRGIRNHS